MDNSCLQAAFYQRETSIVAKELLGKLFIRKLPDNTILSGIIVETEAYLPTGDLACHAAVKKSKRNAAIFLDGGHLYIYKIYGIHFCVNFVTELEGKGCAVLIRAIEPMEGVDAMRSFRGIDDKYRLCKGPGNLAKALSIDLSDNGKSLSSKEFHVEKTNYKTMEIITTNRIGIVKSADLDLRFYIKNNKFVSKK